MTIEEMRAKHDEARAAVEALNGATDEDEKLVTLIADYMDQLPQHVFDVAEDAEKWRNAVIEAREAMAGDVDENPPDEDEEAEVERAARKAFTLLTEAIR